MMFINARPRYVSNAFGTFVPVQRVNSVHQRLSEMTNNDLNAWGNPRPVHAYQSDSWDQQPVDYGNENFPFDAIYTGYYQNSGNPVQHQVSSFKTPTYSAEYTPVYQPQFQSLKRPSNSPNIYHDPRGTMSSFEKQSPMLGSEYSNYNLRRRDGSFMDFSSTRNNMRELSYTGSADGGETPYRTELSPAPQDASYHQTVTDTKANPQTNKVNHTSYSSYSSSSSSVDPQTLICSSGSIPQEASENHTWWPEIPGNNKTQCQSFEIPLYNDGLPVSKNHSQSQQDSGLWGAEHTAAHTWTSPPHAMMAATVSPKALTLSVPPPPMSLSGLSQGSSLIILSPLSDSTSNFAEEVLNYSAPEPVEVVEHLPPVRKHRQILPDSIPSSRRVVPILRSLNGSTEKKKKAKRPLRSSRNLHREEDIPQVSTTDSDYEDSKESAERTQMRASKDKETASTSESTPVQQAVATKGQSPEAIQAKHKRNAKDDFLVKSKLAGMSYKDIRHLGNFTEAESTLRGRFRTLTKHKTARVRKPEWTENDVRLLKRAVRKLSSGSKIPWKQVGEYIVDHGGSYHFGNSTCRKRWDEEREALR